MTLNDFTDDLALLAYPLAAGGWFIMAWLATIAARRGRERRIMHSILIAVALSMFVITVILALSSAQLVTLATTVRTTRLAFLVQDIFLLLYILISIHDLRREWRAQNGNGRRDIS